MSTRRKLSKGGIRFAAPALLGLEKYGFTVDNVIAKAKALLG